MTVSSAILVPELQHWFYDFVVNSAVNKYSIPMPVDIPLLQLEPKNRGSFIEMLFNNNYSYSYYQYLYKPNASWGCIPQVALNRLQIYPGAGKYMKLDPTDGTNTFCLKQHDLTMLNVLLAYRQDATSVTIIDTTANVLNFVDSTAKILTVNYDYLNTNLSKLIYLYLDLKIRSNIDKYNNTTLVCDTVLEACYEAYVLDEYFKFISARGT